MSYPYLDPETLARSFKDGRAIKRRLSGPAVHKRIGSPLAADLRDLIAAIRAEPSSHLVVAVLGFMAGASVTVGLAYLYAAAAF